MSASDDDSVNSDNENTLMFQCRKCPGKLFTHAERDIHRQYHKKHPEAATPASAGGRKKPGPKSRTSRAPSPAHSTVTLFDQVLTPTQSSTDGTQGTTRLRHNKPADGGKRRANKRGDPDPEDDDDDDDDDDGDNDGDNRRRHGANAAKKKKKIRSNKRLNKDYVNDTKYPGG